MASFSIDILTPSKIVAKDLAAESLKVPTTRGEIEILPDHTHIIEKLDTGVLEVNANDRQARFSITTGIVKVLGSQVTILSNVSEAADQIDRDRAQKALEIANQKLGKGSTLTEAEVLKFKRKLDRAKMRLLLSS